MHAQEEPGKKAARDGQAPRRAVAGPGDLARGPIAPRTIMGLQRSAGNRAVNRLLAQEHGSGCGHDAAGDTGPAAARDLLGAALASPSRPLPGALREEAESFYQSDLSATRIHDNPVAQRATAAMGAEAMTVGTHVFLPPAVAHRKDILGHELGHVEKNIRGVRETGSDNGAGVSVTDPGQASERTAESDGAAFAAGAQIAPSVAAMEGRPADDAAVNRR